MKITRREFVWQAAAGAAGLMAGSSGCALVGGRPPVRQVMTVLGPVLADGLGPTLPHEHIFLDFIGAAEVSRDRYDPDEIFEATLPHLEQVKDLGCDTLVECTPAYIGRDAALLKRLAKESGLNLVTNTGYYGAGRNKFLPRHAMTENADELAVRWLTEWRDGIEGTDVRPGFIKIGVDGGKLSDVHRKLVRAAARAHLASGLTIAAHTGDGVAALDELLTLKEEGVAPGAFIWVHAQNERDPDVHARAANLGAWVEFDHISSKDLGRHVLLAQEMRERGLLHRVLVSHDAGWYEVGKPNGGQFRPYDTLFKEFLPALKEAGFNHDEIQQLLVVNPREAFTIQRRARKG
jgi:predicted metal-dependent phosphotriesterase family hydrolase